MESNIFKQQKKYIPYILAPGVLIYVFVVLTPLFIGLKYGFYDWSGGPKKIFIFFDNYIRLIHDQDFLSSLLNNFKLMVVVMFFQLIIAFILALVLNSKLTKWKDFHRFAIFLPVVVSQVAVSILWKLIYNQNYGLLNRFLNSVGLSFLTQKWLDDPKVVLYSVAAVIIWQFIGIYLVIFLSGLQAVPNELYESAQIDGANAITRTTKITIPLMKQTILVALILAIAGSMKIFDHIYVMTGGGPGKASTVAAMYAYNMTFKRFEYGYASAISMAILLVSLSLIIITQLIIKLISNSENKGIN